MDLLVLVNKLNLVKHIKMKISKQLLLLKLSVFFLVKILNEVDKQYQ